MKRFAKYVASVAILVGLIVGLAQIGIARSNADPAVGCESIGWGLNIFGNWTQRRAICDGPRRSDGSWERARVIYVPAGYVPRTSYCGTYSCSWSGGYWHDDIIKSRETYVVFDSNVLGDEPGWLPPGTDRVTS